MSEKSMKRCRRKNNASWESKKWDLLIQRQRPAALWQVQWEAAEGTRGREARRACESLIWVEHLSHPTDLISFFIILTLSWAQAVYFASSSEIPENLSRHFHQAVPTSWHLAELPWGGKQTDLQLLPSCFPRQWGLHPPVPGAESMQATPPGGILRGPRQRRHLGNEGRAGGGGERSEGKEGKATFNMWTHLEWRKLTFSFYSNIKWMKAEKHNFI